MLTLARRRASPLPFVALAAVIVSLWICPRAAAREDEIIVVTDMTDAGKKIPHPSPERPDYYVPISGGAKEQGEIAAGEEFPKANQIWAPLKKALAAQGYLPYQKGSPAPSLLIAFYWGTFAPDKLKGVMLNQRQMVWLVSKSAAMPMDYIKYEKQMDSAEDSRYFIYLTAYDFQAAAKHKKVALWNARISTQSDGKEMFEVASTMIAAGAPFIGRDTTDAKYLDMTRQPTGTVTSGNPTVKEYIEAKDPHAAPANQGSH